MAYSSGQREAVRERYRGKTVAIEVGADGVRAVEIESRGGSPRIVREAEVSLTANVWDDLAGRRDLLADAIRSALTNAGIRDRKAVTVLPRRFVTIKYARLPQGDPDHVAGMVRFEAQQYVPFPIDEVVLDHQIVSDSTDEMSTVLIAAARKPLIKDLLAAFDRAGVEILTIGVSSLALAEHLAQEAMPTAICRAEDGQLDIAVAAAGKILFTRSADIGADASAETGEWTELTTELTRSIAAYQNEYRTRPVEKVILIGDNAATAAAADAVERTFQVHAQKLKGGSDGRVISGAEALAIGLALHDSSAPLSTVNLLPSERIERRAEVKRRTMTRASALVMVAVLIVAGWLAQQALAARASERRLAIIENARLRKIKPFAKKASDERSRLEDKVAAVSEGLGRDEPLVDVIKAVSDAIPSGGALHLTQMTMDRNGPVVLHGNAGSQAQVTRLLTSLQSAGVFAEARLGYLGDAKEGSPTGMAGNEPGQDGDQTMSFMVYCRLPERPSVSKKTTTEIRARRAGGGTAAKVIE